MSLIDNLRQELDKIEQRKAAILECIRQLEIIGGMGISIEPDKGSKSIASIDNTQKVSDNGPIQKNPESNIKARSPKAQDTRPGYRRCNSCLIEKKRQFQISNRRKRKCQQER